MRRSLILLALITTACSAVLDAGRFQGGDAAAAPDAGPRADGDVGDDAGTDAGPDAGDGRCGSDAECPGDTNVCNAGVCFECDGDSDDYLAGDAACDGLRGLNPVDCDDTEPTVHPFAPVVCSDGLINNCAPVPTDYATALGVQEIGVEDAVTFFEGASPFPLTPHLSAGSTARWDGSVNLQTVHFLIDLPSATFGLTQQVLVVGRQAPRMTVVELEAVDGFMGVVPGGLILADLVGVGANAIGYQALEAAGPVAGAIDLSAATPTAGLFPLTNAPTCWPGGAAFEGHVGGFFVATSGGTTTFVNYQLGTGMDPMRYEVSCHDASANPPFTPAAPGNLVGLGTRMMTSGSEQLQVWDGTNLPTGYRTQAPYLLQVPAATVLGSGDIVIANRRVLEPPMNGFAPGLDLEAVDCDATSCMRTGSEGIDAVELQTDPSITQLGAGAVLATVEELPTRSGDPGRGYLANLRFIDGDGALVPGFELPVRYSEATDTTGTQLATATVRIAAEAMPEPGFFGAILVGESIRDDGNRRVVGLPFRGCETP